MMPYGLLGTTVRRKLEQIIVLEITPTNIINKNEVVGMTPVSPYSVCWSSCDKRRISENYRNCSARGEVI